jgi:energy-coupling factor transporter ATP-binding protein EcfA2
LAHDLQAAYFARGSLEKVCFDERVHHRGNFMDIEKMVFISYAHKDTSISKIAAFTQFLHDCLPNKISILLDRKYLGIGKTIPNYVQYLETCPAAIVLMTPEYKRRSENATGSVFGEYEIIHKRLLNEEDEFLCLPVLFEGTTETAIPRLFVDKIHEDFTNFYPRLDDMGKKYYLNNKLREVFIPVLLNVARVIEARIQVRALLPPDKYERMHEILFAKTKITRDWLMLHPEFCNHLFVDTHSYKRIKNQYAVFLIGRKGSGKSTIANTLPQLEYKQYKACISMLADQINLLETYHMIDHKKYGSLFDTVKYYFAGRTSEFTQLNPTQLLFKYAWLGVLYICFARELCELGKTNKLNALQKSYYDLLLEEFNKFTFGQSKNIEASKYFTVASVAFAEFWDRIVTDALSLQNFTEVVRYIDSNVNEERYLEMLLSRPLLDVLRNIVSHCDRSVLITLDDFDSVFSIFRNSLKHAEKEDVVSDILATLEPAWIQSLMLLILELKGYRKGWRDPFFKRVDFCITIPRDSYSHVIYNDRDAFLNIECTVDLEWTGVYLAQMLLKRLSYMYDEIYDSTKDVLSELNRVSLVYLNRLPPVVRFDFNGEAISVNLFLYVLRHSFWRPRDILKYYAALMTAALSSPGDDLSVEQVRLIVGMTAKVIVKTEFIGEFKDVITNLEKIINQFRKSPQLLQYNDVYEKVKDISFSIGHQRVLSNFSEKIRILYEIGFIGLLVSEDIAKIEKITSTECFYFNEGMEIFDNMAKYSFEDCSFLIHPIFVEELQIDHRNNHFILNWKDQYLQNNHIVRIAGLEAF